MDKGYAKDIEAEASNENKSISEKLAVFTGAAAVLGLVAAFNQKCPGIRSRFLRTLLIVIWRKDSEIQR